MIKLIRTSWPKAIKDVPEIAKSYHTYHSELFESEGLLFKNNCVVVPGKLRKEILGKLHHYIESPNKLMFNRNVRGLLPDFVENSRPENEPIREKLVEQQKRQKYFHDKRARSLPELTPGETVRIQNTDKTLQPGIIINKSDKPRAYNVMKESGVI